MKTLVITNDFPPRVGGINYYVDQIVRRFPAGEVTVLAPAWPGSVAFDAEYPHEVVRWTSTRLLPTPPVRDRAIDLVRTEHPDVVLFGAALPFALIGPAIMRETGIPYASFTHGMEMGWGRVPGGKQLVGRVGRDAILLTTVSAWTRDILRDAVGPRPRIELLPPGVDTDLFHPEVSDAEVRERHGLWEDPVICCVSRLVARKGQDQLIEALPRIAAEVPNVRFLVVGSGPYEKKLWSLAKERGVEHRVVFAGEVPYRELPMYFRAGDVFAMPSRPRWFGLEVEALGAVYLQAYAVGRPCIIGESGGAPEAALDGDAGLVVDGTSAAEIGGAALGLLKDPERSAKMGSAGAEWVHRDLGWGTIARRLHALLEGCLR
jgi:phosphatidylinositol alpha-1,6-mannosyltransferase